MAKRFNIEGEYSSTNDYVEQVTIPLNYNPQNTPKVSGANNKVNEQNPRVKEYNEEKNALRRISNQRKNKPNYKRDRRLKRATQNFWISVNTGSNDIEMGD